MINFILRIKLQKMTLETLDWVIITAYFVFILAVGLFFSRKSGKDINSYFLSGRSMPWWLLGLSMVATTFSADTPNLVTELVRKDGVSGNWAWWAFLLTGMLTVFVYSKLWRRSMVLTDIEFYELRYSGKAAAFLRGFRALYLGLIFNVLVMGAVSLAAIKFGEIILGWEAWKTMLIAGSVTVVYTYFGGLKAILITDVVQFVLAMIGSIWACMYILDMPEIGGLSNLLTNEIVMPKLSMLPDFSNPESYIPILIIPLAVQWWASYYPGSEPGGGGYIAQRMFSAKDEKNAVGATLLFNIAHYAIRPWPWILIALASLIIFPQVADIQSVFPNISEGKLGDDIAYPAMLSFLPAGLLGLVAASLIAAFMSTMSTQMNLGSSYLVNDFYARFIKPTANDKELIQMAKLFTLISAILGMGLGMMLESAKETFDIMLILGAGTGLVYILRWFWWRINAMTEIVAMIASLIIAGSLFFVSKEVIPGWGKITIGAILTTITWVITALITKPTDEETLKTFYEKIQPSGYGWHGFLHKMKAKGNPVRREKGYIAVELSLAFFGAIAIFSALFAIGNFVYGQYLMGSILTIVAALGAYYIFWGLNKRVKMK